LTVFSKTTPDNDFLYKEFGMTHDNFSKSQLKKQMNAYTKKFHPDKNKDKDTVAQWHKYQEYFEILNDDKKRAEYDRLGYENYKAASAGGGGGGGGYGGGHGGFGGFGGGGFEDIFEKFFGGGGRGQQHRQPVPRTSDLQYKVQITLKDAFLGELKHFPVTRTILCKKCKGTGADNPSEVSTCPGCRGTGAKTYIRQFGPGMVQQVRTVCDQCSGRGKTFKTECTSCRGRKVERIKEVLDLKLDPGLSDGTQVKYSGKADEEPDKETGDLIVTIGIEEDKVFRRDGANLYTKITISLEEVKKINFVI
jgi:DnaJ-class molecular chaperone